MRTKGIAMNWKQKFIMMWLGQGVSIFTSAVIQMAMVWYLTERTNSAAILAFATMLGFIPQVVLGPFIGVFIDRYPRKKVMILSDLFIALVSMVLVVGGRFGELPVGLILGVIFARALGTTLHAPSLQAVTPLFVPKEELTRYAGYSQGVESISMLLSPGIAAMLFGVFKLHQIILFDVFGALFAITTLCFVTIPKLEVSAESLEGNVLHGMKEGIAAIRRKRGLFSLMFVCALYALIYFPVGTMYPLISMSYFRGGYKGSGIVETVFCVGMLIGSFVLSRLGKRIKKMKAIAFSIFLYGLGLTIVGLLPPEGFWIFVGLSLVMGVSIPFYRGVQLSIFQMKIEPEYLGRVMALVSSIRNISMPVGLLLVAGFVDIVGVEKWFFVSGILSLLLAVCVRGVPALRELD